MSVITATRVPGTEINLITTPARTGSWTLMISIWVVAKGIPFKRGESSISAPSNQQLTRTTKQTLSSRGEIRPRMDLALGSYAGKAPNQSQTGPRGCLQKRPTREKNWDCRNTIGIQEDVKSRGNRNVLEPVAGKEGNNGHFKAPQTGNKHLGCTLSV